MDDLDLDRELKSALAVTPSPEFVARVRTTIAQQPRPSRFAGWAAPAAAVACAVVVAIAAGLREEARVQPSPAEHALSTNAIAPTTIDARTTETAPTAGLKASTTNTGTHSPAFAKATAGRSARQANPVKETALPEVIIAPEDVVALEHFVASTRELRFVASFDEAPVSTPWIVTDVSISPITIEPLDEASVHN